MDRKPWGGNFNTGGQPISPESPLNQTGGQPPVVSPDTGYPFEEPEQAPELRSERSENLYSRNAPFWERPHDAPQPQEEPPLEDDGYPLDENYWNHPAEMQGDCLLTVTPNQPGDRLRAFLGSGVVRKLLLIVSIFLVIGLLLYSTMFQTREIHVVGNASIPAQEIIRLSGLELGVNTMTIDEDVITERIERNRYLRCTLVDVKWNSVTLHVTERVPAVYINHNGMTVVLDNRGWVLEESLSTKTVHDSLIFVTGLDVRRCILGQEITLTGNSQMRAYTCILVEMKAMKGLDLVKELDLSRMDRIYLATRDGFYVHLGDDERIHEKLRAMLVTREKLIEMQYTGGTIDVTDPENPTFTPVGVS